ncbi:MAG: aminoacyl-histidine dipeptidase [Clostridiales bacterium]|nr:aminoacyl-histidine dipeptidase [Clostridiales bacterium]
MSVFENTEPKNVFHYFEEICRIPHGSGNTQAISDYCAEFAKAHGLACRQESCGNVIIWKDASPGYEDADTVMLQGHMDMVAVKEADCDIDMETEGLRPAVTGDGEWIYAKGTSLGGDDGIAIAYALAILADDTLRHPALEAVFTVDEEIGLLGAAVLDTSDLKSRILLNMDSEDDGIFLTSCAGGATFTAYAPAPREEKSGVVYELEIGGLQGGHSGAQIHLGRANANLIFDRFLAQVGETVDFSVGDFSGGEKDNAIPNRCRAVLVASAGNAAKLEEAAADFSAVVRAEYAVTEPDFFLTLTRQEETSAAVLSGRAAETLTALLEHLPSGVLRMMPDFPDMVQTSLNLGILRLEKKEFSMTFSVRSASATEKEWVLKRMKDLTEMVGGRWELSGDYPAWEYRQDSKIRQVMAETYGELTGQAPILTGIHAGVECGLILEKMPGIDCISYGPQMRDIHTARERLNIASVQKNYELTTQVLEKLR